MGFCGHIGISWTETPATLMSNLLLVDGKILREDIDWGRVEPTAGNLAYPGVNADLIRLSSTFDLCNQNNIKPLAILDYGNNNYGDAGLPLTSTEITAFTNYASFVAETAANQISEYEVWNEWNIGLGANASELAAYSYLDPEGYYNLLASVYPAVKAANPNAFVWGGVVSDPMEMTNNGNSLGLPQTKHDWFEQYTNLPNWSEYMDGFSFHHYYAFSRPEYWFWQVRGIIDRARLKAGNPSLPVMLSEGGWFNGTDPQSVSETISGNYYSRWPFLLRCTGIDQATFYALRNDGTGVGKEDNFGVFSSTYVAKEAALALQDVLPVVHSSNNASYWTDGFRHVVLLDDNKLAFWTDSNSSYSINIEVTATASGTASLKTAGVSSTTESISVGTNLFTYNLSTRAQILELPANSIIFGFS